ncbi:cuticle protein 1-like [Ischnura elegans]|uniref:cuticle protein 1-like n=1 Tax=Ischnura elegans TaxID=197161 RepID=UPI001ED8BDD5|nr:cuticle protein 1-like [Ischnura elegans]
MTAHLVVLAICIAAVVGSGVPAARYPAGVDPHTCPNYPYCDNVPLAVGHHGAIAPYAAHSYAAYGHHGAISHGAGAKYPADVDPHLCPHYPYCDTAALDARGVHGIGYGFAGHGYPYAAHGYGYGVYGIHHGAGARYPAGVDPHSCPNYPYCHH